jgi:hypothetical protein
MAVNKVIFYFISGIYKLLILKQKFILLQIITLQNLSVYFFHAYFTTFQNNNFKDTNNVYNTNTITR